MPSALLKQSKVRLRRRFLASAKPEQVRLCSRLIENVLRFLTLRRRGRPFSEIASAAGSANACVTSNNFAAKRRYLRRLAQSATPAAAEDKFYPKSSACGSEEPRSSPPPHRGGLQLADGSCASCRRRRTAEKNEPNPRHSTFFFSQKEK